jgi:uncharacterized iron-regulated protein
LAPGATAQDLGPIQPLDLDNPLSMERLITQLATRRVVFVGETHDRYDNHLNQLEVIRRLHQLDPNLAIGVEYFPRQFQPQVDDYIAERITEDQFLRAVDYYRTWGYDYRLYAPIFRFAREQRIPMRALNVAASVVLAVAKVGIKGLSEQQRASCRRRSSPPTKPIGHVSARRSRNTRLRDLTPSITSSKHNWRGMRVWRPVPPNISRLTRAAAW